MEVRTWERAAVIAFGLILGLGLFCLWNARSKKLRPQKSMDFTFEFGETIEAGAFFDRHPNLYPAFEHLLVLINKCFARTVPKPYHGADRIQFGLGQACKEDFLEILFLAANGYDIGALKLLRGLYERAVTLAYMVKEPIKTERFANFAQVQEHKALKDARKVTTEEQWDAVMGLGNTAAEIRNRFEVVKKDFEQTDCAKCKTKRLAFTWDLDVASMVAKVGAPYDMYYLLAYTKANFEIHATLASALREDNKDQVARQAQRHRQADTALFCAAMLVVEVVRSQNTLFSLDLNDEIQVAEEAMAKVWKESSDVKNIS